MEKPTFSREYMNEVQEIAKKMDTEAIEKAVDLLVKVREANGRVFVIGVGGGAGNASHAVCDLRKIAGIEAYATTDNVSEVTARTNDDGFHTIFEPWLKTSHLNSKDAILVLSVGGGDADKQISVNLIHALKYANSVNAKTLGIVGKSTGYTAQTADVCIVVPTVNPERITAHSESFQEAIWHLFVFHPKLRLIQGKWESVSGSDNKAK